MAQKSQSTETGKFLYICISYTAFFFNWTLIIFGLSFFFSDQAEKTDSVKPSETKASILLSNQANLPV